MRRQCVFLLPGECVYLDIEVGTPPTDWTQVAPNAFAKLPSLSISVAFRGRPYLSIPVWITSEYMI